MAGQNSAAGLGCLTSPARIELAYRLAREEDHQDHPGPRVTRGNLLRVTLPFFLACVVLWGVACLWFLPTTG